MVGAAADAILDTHAAPDFSTCRPRLRGGRLYSPDMNPIEMALAKLEALLRQDPARTVDTLFKAT